MSFVPEWSSHCIHKIKSTEGVIGFARPDTHGQLAPDLTRFAIFNLERISFLVYVIPEWNLVPEWAFHSDWKPENDWNGEQNFVTVSCKQMERNALRWNELVPEWKSFRYHVNSPLSRVTCMASRSMHILMSHFCDTQMGGICHIFFITLGCTQVHLNQTYNHTKLTLFFTGFWGMSWISKYWRCKDCLWWYVSP